MPDDWDFDQYAWNTLWVFLISIGVLGSKSDKEKRDRYYRMLPLPISRVAIGRFLFAFVVMFALWLTWMLFMWLRPEGITLPSFWFSLTLMGGFLAVVTVFMIHHDFGYFGTRKYKFMIYGALLLIVMLIVAAALGDVLDNIYHGHADFVRTPVAAAVYWALCVVLYYAGAHVFIRRKSYLE